MAKTWQKWLFDSIATVVLVQNWQKKPQSTTQVSVDCGWIFINDFSCRKIDFPEGLFSLISCQF
jgi:hypothetical protein